MYFYLFVTPKLIAKIELRVLSANIQKSIKMYERWQHQANGKCQTAATTWLITADIWPFQLLAKCVFIQFQVLYRST